MTDSFVIADAHGNADLVRKLLEQEGIVDPIDGRIDDVVTVVQLGDLANCVAASTQNDIHALDLVILGLIDFILIGNHEHPYFGGPAFSGYWPDGEVRRRLYQIRDRGAMKAAHAVGDVLVSHAGLTSYWLREFGAWGMSAVEIADLTNGVWENDPEHLFSAPSVGAAEGGNARAASFGLTGARRNRDTFDNSSGTPSQTASVRDRGRSASTSVLGRTRPG